MNQFPLHTRREFLQKGLVLVASSFTVPTFLMRTVFAVENPLDLKQTASVPGVPDDRILIVIQLGGGNDGLNTVVPFSFDPYYKLRPVLVEVAQGGRIENWLTGFSGGRFPKLSLVQSRFTEARLHFTGSSSSSASRCRRTAPSPSRSTYWQRP